jgi:hypothetical protein
MTIVSFNVAKLLKENNYLNICQFYYDENYKLTYGGNDKWNLYKYAYAAPKLFDVVIWCFEKYNHSIEYSFDHINQQFIVVIKNKHDVIHKTQSYPSIP